MSEQNVNTLRRGLEAFNSEDIERILTFVDPEFEAVVPSELSAEPDSYLGHDGIRRYFQTFQDVMDEIRFEPERFWDVGELVVADVRVTAKGKKTAIAVEQRTAQVWKIRHGKAIAVRAYASLPQALASAGLEEHASSG